MKTSARLFEISERRIPGGVNSPVRAFRGVGGKPLFFERGMGAYLFDADGALAIWIMSALGGR